MSLATTFRKKRILLTFHASERTELRILIYYRNVHEFLDFDSIFSLYTANIQLIQKRLSFGNLKFKLQNAKYKKTEVYHITYMSGLFAEKTFCRNDNLPKIEKF